MIPPEWIIFGLILIGTLIKILFPSYTPEDDNHVRGYNKNNEKKEE